MVIHCKKKPIKPKNTHACIINSKIKTSELRRSTRISDLRKKEQTLKRIGEKISHCRLRNKKTKMEFVKKVDDLSFDGNLAENWRSFKKAYDIFELAADVVKKKDESRIAIFLNAAGKEAQDLLDTLPLTDEEKKSYKNVVDAYEAFCIPKKNVVYERFVFYSRNQKEGEAFDNFLVDIKKLFKTCEFGDHKDDMIRDRIVMGITDKRIQEKMLKEDIDLKKVVEWCRATE